MADRSHMADLRSPASRTLSESDAANFVQKLARGRLQRSITKKAKPRKLVDHGKIATVVHRLQANAVPLQLGIVLALIWANAHPESYELVLGTRSDTIRLWSNAEAFGHPLTIHYIM